MNAADHAALARADDRAAVVQANAYDPAATLEHDHCHANAPADEDICWTSVTNPTEDHLTRSIRLRRAAAQQRAASQALRDTEGRNCMGISAYDRDTDPFLHSEDLGSITVLADPGNNLGGGATVVFHAVPGLTTERLQRVIDCHIARNAVVGHADPDMANCALGLQGTSAHVAAMGQEFSVAIRSRDTANATEILRRARLLTRP